MNLENELITRAVLRAPAEASTYMPQDGNLDNVAEGYSPNSIS